MITVCSVADLSFQFHMADGRILTIAGKHKASTDTTGLLLPYGRTKMDVKDFEEIKKKYAHMYELRTGIIFAEKNESENFAKGTDSETQSKPRGTEKIKAKDLGNNVIATDNPASLVE